MKKTWILLFGLGLVAAGAGCSSSDSSSSGSGGASSGSGGGSTGGGTSSGGSSGTGGTTGTGGGTDASTGTGGGTDASTGTGGGTGGGYIGDDAGPPSIDPDASAGACNRLRDCCDKVPADTDGTPDKSVCLETATLGEQFADAGGDLTCAAFLKGYQTTAVCP